jgi:hypothetical protein
VDTGCHPIHSHGPLFPDGSFELVPIPDTLARDEKRTYGNTVGRLGRPLLDFFPARRAAIANHPMHVDPEFDTFTYGSPARIQTNLASLEAGDMLVFYGGLQLMLPDGNPPPPAALYLFGYFQVERAVRAREYSREALLPVFGANFHVRHADVLARQQDRLVLVKGETTSRLLTKARRISSIGRDRRGKPIHVLSAEMQQVFGAFSGVGSIQRCVPRWVSPDKTQQAADFVRSLP